MGQGFISKYILRGIADFIRGRKNTTAEIKPVDMVAELESIPTYEQGIEQGKQAQYHLLWDHLQRYGKRVHYVGAFSYTGWDDEIYDPPYPIDPTNMSGISNMFIWNQGVTDTKVPISARGSCLSAFANSSIKRIVKLIWDGATNINDMFLNCTKLEELYCEGVIDITGINLQWSTKLSHDSIVSIMHCLSVSTNGLYITLPLEAVEREFTPEEWDELVASRPNWTILLV